MLRFSVEVSDCPESEMFSKRILSLYFYEFDICQSPIPDYTQVQAEGRTVSSGLAEKGKNLIVILSVEPASPYLLLNLI